MAYTPPVGIVDFNLGQEEPVTVTTYELVLTSPYTEPSGNLLVLRSRPDVEPIAGTMAVVETGDRAAFEGLRRLPVDPVIGTLAATNKADTASFAGTTAPGAITGTLTATESQDTASFTGEGFAGIARRTGTLVAVESRDTATATATYLPKWKATIAATEPGDVGAFDGAFIPYSGPGFLNTTERRDGFTATGRIIYDVAMEMAATESADVSAIAMRTGEVFDVEVADTVIVSELLAGEDQLASLVDRIVVTDSLDYSRDMAFADTASVSDTLASQLRVSEGITDTLVSTDVVQPVYSAVSVDIVVVTELLLGENPLDHSDVVAITEGLASQSALSGVLTDIAIAADVLTMVRMGDVADTVTATDTLASEIGYGAGLADTVNATETWTGALQVSLAITDTGYLREVLDSAKEVATTDTIQFMDTLVSPLSTTAGLVDTAIVSDVLAGAFTVYAPSLVDQVVVADSLTSGMTLVGVLADTVIAGDVLYVAEAQTVYVVNAETGAVSTYQFTPTITGMAEYQGVLYLSGPDGLYALDADQDEDGDVVWTLRTGFSNLGTDLLKRVQDCNFQARTECDTTFQVVSDRYGQKQEWNYRLPPLTRDSYRDGVVKVGRGVQSVYWQFAAEGIGPAEIDQLRLVIEPLSRRR